MFNNQKITYEKRQEINNDISKLSFAEQEKFYDLYEKHHKSKAKTIYLQSVFPHFILQNFYVGIDSAPKITTILGLGFFLLLYFFWIVIIAGISLLFFAPLLGIFISIIGIGLVVLYEILFYIFLSIKIDSVIEEVDNINYMKKESLLKYVKGDMYGSKLK